MPDQDSQRSAGVGPLLQPKHPPTPPPPAPLTHSFCRYVNRGQGLRARLPWVPKPLDLFKSVCISLPTHHVWILQFTSEQRFLMSISGKFLPGGPSAVWSGELLHSTGSSSLCSVMTWRGGIGWDGVGGWFKQRGYMYMYIYITDSFVCAAETNTIL